MAEEQVLVGGENCKACEAQESNRQSRRKLDQNDLNLLSESVQRITLIGRTLWEFDEMNEVERGTISVMLKREADHIFETVCSLEARLGI